MLIYTEDETSNNGVSFWYYFYENTRSGNQYQYQMNTSGMIKQLKVHAKTECLKNYILVLCKTINV